MKMGIMSKMMLNILVPSMLGLTAVCVFSYWRAETSLTQQIAHELNTVIDKQVHGLVTVQQMTRGLMKTSAQSNHVRNALIRRGAGEPTLEVVYDEPVSSGADVQSVLDSLTEHFGIVDGAGLLDIDGRVIAHTARDLVGRNMGERRSVNAALRGSMGFENIPNHAGDLATIITTPVMKDGKPYGVLYAYMSLARLSADTTDTIKIGKDSFCAVYDSEGRVLMHPDKRLLGSDSKHLPFVKAALAEGNGRAVYNHGDAEMVAYYRHMPESNWHVVLVGNRDELLGPARNLLKENMLVGGIAVIVVGFIIIVVSRGIARSIRAGENYVQAVAGGNFNPSQEEETALGSAAKRSDEIGGLSQGIQGMVGKLRSLFHDSEEKNRQAEFAKTEAEEAMGEAQEARKQAENARQEGMLAAAGQLEAVAGIISSASTQLSAQIEQSDRSAAESSQRLSEAATAMNQMNATVREVAHNAAAASTASRETKEKAHAGAQIVEQAVRSIEAVRHVSEELKSDMAELGEHAQSITRIMNVISDIADQTNLLALNAAIEAARAGEAGRGFAVVADEVRKLAEKTMASTHDVSAAIKAIQNSTAKSMGSADNAVNQIAQATTFASESGQALREIVATVEGTSDQVNAIAAASEEQSVASEEINHSIVQVNEMARQSAIAMAEAAQAVTELAAQAHTLKNLIAQMKLG